MLGGDETKSTVEFARAPLPPLFIRISTKTFPDIEFAGISNMICVALMIAQNDDTTAFTVAVQK